MDATGWNDRGGERSAAGNRSGDRAARGPRGRERGRELVRRRSVRSRGRGRRRRGRDQGGPDPRQRDGSGGSPADHRSRHVARPPTRTRRLRQQRRHLSAGSLSGADRRGLGCGPRGQPQGNVPLHPGRREGHDRGRQRGGSIVNLASVAAFRCSPGRGTLRRVEGRGDRPDAGRRPRPRTAPHPRSTPSRPVSPTPRSPATG